MKNTLFRLLLFMLAAPLFFACGTSREFASFSSGSGAYHGSKAKAEARPAAPEITAANQAKTAVSVEADNTTEANLATAPDTRLATVQSRLNQATAEANVQAKTIGAAAAPKLSLVQKLALKKAVKMLDKATSGKELKSKKPTEITKPTLDQNLKLALVFLIAALIASLISHLVGLILLIVSLVFFLLWVLTL